MLIGVSRSANVSLEKQAMQFRGYLLLYSISGFEVPFLPSSLRGANVLGDFSFLE